MVGQRFARFIWGVLAYTVLVILGGALVRATGSGAGCGSHWPLCNGEIIPLSPQSETIIEYAHRASTGLLGVLILGIVIRAFYAYPKGHPIRLGAAGTLFFLITESLFGAALVRLELVADNASIARGVAIALHLVNTYLLLAFLTIAGRWASNGAPIRLGGRSATAWILLLGFVGMLILGASGAIAALGDTLFPPASLLDGLRDDFSPAANILVRLRVFHPLIAVVVGTYLIGGSTIINASIRSAHLDRLKRSMTALILTQFVAGVLNVIWLAPVWLQIVHLLISDLIWINLVLYAASALTDQPLTRHGLEAALSSNL